MGAYHQIGHDSQTMILEKELNHFSGAILSPVNYSPTETVIQCRKFRELNITLDIIFDPQLYMPSASRGELKNWSHKPNDLDTADQSSLAWWSAQIGKINSACYSFLPSGICSPAFLPRTFNDEYYSLTVNIANEAAKQLQADTTLKSTRPILTALVGLTDLGREGRYLQVSSIFSKYKCEDIYLVFVDDEKPRLERTDTGCLEGGCRLISALNNAGFRITVGFTSSSMLLWKAAGAENVATGKFFNLRRFSKARWDEEEPGGGKNIAYWFEPTLLAFIREADLRRYRKEFDLDFSHLANPFSKKIIDKLADVEQKPWVADSWRQFLFWFGVAESEINNDLSQCTAKISSAYERWQAVKDRGLMFEEERNNGEWTRAWSIVLNELKRIPSS